VAGGHVLVAAARRGRLQYALDRGADVETGRAAGPQWQLELDEVGL